MYSVFGSFGKYGKIHAGAKVKMYTAEQAAAALGVTRQTIAAYTRLEKDALPAMRVGRKAAFRIREDDLIEFARKHKMDIVTLKQ